MAEYGPRALEKGLAVLDYLCRGDMLEWRTVAEAAQGAGVSRNEAYGALCVLVRVGWVEKGEKGYRPDKNGLVKYALEAQECLVRAADKLGVRR
jgi:DNA-binding IclR family transcriptional regulator